VGDRRVLITGSRDWEDWAAIWRVLDEELLIARSEGRGLIVVHGKSPRGGADEDAERWVLDKQHKGVQDVDQEPHAPDLTKHLPRRAPLIRNGEMARSGINRAHAFPLYGSHGTRHCMSRCFAANVPLVNHGYQPYTEQAREFARAYG
jgi:hypothetical protein